MPFWNLNYCAEHDGCDRCCSCQRVEVRAICFIERTSIVKLTKGLYKPIAPDRQFHQLSDRRKVCHDCCKYIVLDTSEVLLIYTSIMMSWLRMLNDMWRGRMCVRQAQDVVKEVWAYMRAIGINLPEVRIHAPFFRSMARRIALCQCDMMTLHVDPGLPGGVLCLE